MTDNFNVVQGAKCTCERPDPEQKTHENDCELWEWDPWMLGDVDWDHEAQVLVKGDMLIEKELLLAKEQANLAKGMTWDELDALDSIEDVIEGNWEPLDCVCKPQKKFICLDCHVERDAMTEPWGPLHGVAPPKSANKGKVVSFDDLDEEWYGFSKGKGSNVYVGAAAWTEKCRHMEQPVLFPDGTTVYASSALSHEVPKGIPDFGLYAYDGWRPRGLSWYIPWRDYGLPEIPLYVAAGAIVDVFNHAKSGLSVEVGCAGGHGRTGTILACMAVLGGVHERDAVKYVQDNYCSHAVEADIQEWFVLWFAAWLHDEPTPARPHKPPPAPPKPITPKASTPKAVTSGKNGKKKGNKGKEPAKAVASTAIPGTPVPSVGSLLDWFRGIKPESKTERGK